MDTTPRITAQDERGSMLPLTIFFGVLALVVVLLVTAATSLYLERKRLFTLADGAALVGAEAFDLDEVMMGEEGPQIVLRSRPIEVAVTEYVGVNAPASLENLVVEYAGTTDGSSATVELAAFWRPPLLSLLVPSGVRLDVSSTARSVIVRG